MPRWCHRWTSRFRSGLGQWSRPPRQLGRASRPHRCNAVSDNRIRHDPVRPGWAGVRISAEELAALCGKTLRINNGPVARTPAARGGSQERHRMVLQSGFPASGAGQKPLTSAPPSPAAERRPLPCGPGVRVSAEELAALSAHIFRGNAPVSRDSRQTVAPNTRASDPDPADGSKTAAVTSQGGPGPGNAEVRHGSGPGRSTAWRRARPREDQRGLARSQCR